MSKPATISYEFGPFHLDAVKRLLMRDREIVPLTPKAFDILLALVESGHRVLEKSELMNRVWPDSFVEESNLTQNISTLRKALGESASQHQYIVTVPGHGYRFVASVNEVCDEASVLMVERHVRSSIVAEQEEEIESRDLTGEAASQRTLKVNTGQQRRKVWMKNPAFLVAAISAAGLAAALFYFLISSKPKQAETGLGVKLIAVLPFKPIGADSSYEYLGLGMADDLIIKLSNTGEIVVRPTSAVRKYIDPLQDPIAVGRELGVEAVLDGSIRKTGERIRVTVQLLRVRDGKPLWVDRFDEKFTDILAVQDSVSEHLAKALALKLAADEGKRLTKRYTDNSEAFQLYLKGLYHANRWTAEEVKIAIGYFEQAIAKDSNYALAYVGLANCYIKLSSPPIGLLTPKDASLKAKAAVLKALEIDETLAEARVTLAGIKRNEWDWFGVEREFKRAIELSPNSAPAHAGYGAYLSQVARHDECIAEMKRALQLDPLESYINEDLGFRFYIARRYDEAIEQFQKSLDMDPHSWTSHSGLAWVYEQQGRYDEAIAEYEKAKPFSQNDLEILWGFGRVYAASGKRAYAEKVINQLRELSRQRYVSGYLLALIYARLGEKDQAFAWLETAYKDQDLWMKWIKVDPALDNLRSDPRYENLLRRVGLAQ
jgi:DNA-binding winged helix-turn-helix (wHTH) protein/TolB-like protein/tetratricopeptide (TPR) repeat protein